MSRFTFSLPVALRQRIDKAAAKEGRKTAQLVRLLLEKHFAKNTKPGKGRA